MPENLPGYIFWSSIFSKPSKGRRKIYSCIWCSVISLFRNLSL